MKTQAALQMFLVFCVKASLSHDSIGPERVKNIEGRLIGIEEVLNELKRENEALRIFTQALEMKLDSLQAKNKARNIAFSAGLLGPGAELAGPSDTKKTLVYQKVFTNVGDAYNSDTGIFTAPVKGVYFFRFYGHCQSQHRMAVSLYKNNELQCSVYAHKPEINVNGNGSNGVVLTLVKGDEVYTKLWENSWVYDDKQTFTSFSGFLLFTL